MSRFSFSSLRHRLILLVLLSVLPAFGLIIYGGIRDRRHALLAAQTQTLNLARSISARHDNVIDEARALLFTLAEIPEVQRREAAACEAVFAKLLAKLPRYAALMAFTPKGEAFASAPPLKDKVSVTDRSWYLQLLKTRDFVVSEYLIGRRTGKPALAFCNPVIDQQGVLRSIILVGLDLAWFNHLITRIDIPKNTTITIIDRQGTILARCPGPRGWVGQSMPKKPIIEAMLTQGEGVTEVIGLDGVRRVFGFTFLGPPSGGIHIAVGIPKKEVFAEATRDLLICLGGLGLVAGLALIVAWLGGDVFIRRPVIGLLSLTRRLGEGDLRVRTGPPYQRGELGQLAQGFDNMAIALQRHEAQRDLAEKALREHANFLQNLIDTIPSPIFFKNVAGIYLGCNKAFSEFVGLPKEEIKGKSASDIYSQEVADKNREMDLALLRQPGTQVYDYTALHANGNKHEVTFYKATYTTMDGTLAGLVGVMIDITARKQAEENLKQAHDYLENIFANSADGIGIVDQDGNFQRWNKAAEEIYGYTFEELRGRPAADLYADQDELQRMLTQLRQKASVKNYLIDMKRKDGSIFPASLSIGLLYSDHQVIGSVAVGRDLTELQSIIDKLRLANEKLQILVAEAEKRNREITLINGLTESLQSCLVVEEAYPIITHCIQHLFESMSGALFMLQTSNLLEVVSFWGNNPVGEQVCAPDDCWALRRCGVYLSGSSFEAECCPHLPDKVPKYYVCIPLIAQGETLGLLHVQSDGEVKPSVVGRFKDMAVTIGDNISLALANIRLRETLRHQVIHDPLTGLFNRRYLDETLEREIHRVRRKRASLGIIMMDLDNFKRFNDTYGHEAGDRLLQTLGNFLEAQVRQEDIACRYGGEEFVLILPEASLDATQRRAEGIRQGVAQLQVSYRERTFEMTTVSLGVAVFPEHGATGQDVLRAADDAMYQAKAAGRNRVVVAEGHN